MDLHLDAIRVMENERECVRMAESCDRDCGKCPLVMDSSRILTAYDYAIDLLRRTLTDGK